jgi:outer membrane protein OmpA-like peptidoglycan-associated protein
LYSNSKGYLFNSSNFNYSDVTRFEPIVMDIRLDPVARGSSVVLNNIFFETDKYELQQKSLTELQKVVRFLEENPVVSIQITGHTDNTGNAAYNQQLSEKRAQAVYNYLIAEGISDKRLSWKGFGQGRPKASNDTEEGRQLNRRIEFSIQ